MTTHHDNVWIEYDSGWEMQESLAQELERAVADLQDGLASILYDEADEEFETPSGMPYCGCSTCDAREVLVMLVPMVAAAVEAGRLRRPEGVDSAFIHVVTQEDA